MLPFIPLNLPAACRTLTILPTRCVYRAMSGKGIPITLQFGRLTLSCTSWDPRCSMVNPASVAGYGNICYFNYQMMYFNPTNQSNCGKQWWIMGVCLCTGVCLSRFTNMRIISAESYIAEIHARPPVKYDRLSHSEPQKTMFFNLHLLNGSCDLNIYRWTNIQPNTCTHVFMCSWRAWMQRFQAGLNGFSLWNLAVPLKLNPERNKHREPRWWLLSPLPEAGKKRFTYCICVCLFEIVLLHVCVGRWECSNVILAWSYTDDQFSSKVQSIKIHLFIFHVLFNILITRRPWFCFYKAILQWRFL